MIFGGHDRFLDRQKRIPSIILPTTSGKTSYFKPFPLNYQHSIIVQILFWFIFRWTLSVLVIFNSFSSFLSLSFSLYCTNSMSAVLDRKNKRFCVINCENSKVNKSKLCNWHLMRLNGRHKSPLFLSIKTASFFSLFSFWASFILLFIFFFCHHF